MKKELRINSKNQRMSRIRDSKMKKARLRKHKRKVFLNRLIIISSFLFFLTLVTVGIIFGLNTIFCVKEIYAKSNLRYDSQSIIYASGIKVGDNLCFLNSKEIEKRICQSLPYIEKAEIKKSFPDKVSIEVEITEPSWTLVSDGKYFLIGENNKLLEERSEGIPELRSILGSKFSISSEGEIIYEDNNLKDKIELIKKIFKEKGLILTKSIDVSDSNNIVVNYDNRIYIHFGDEEDIDYKALTAAEIISNKIGSSEKGILDLKTVKKDNRSYFIPE